MKRHDALIPLSHDHHHALAHARRLRRSADSDDADGRLARAGDFLRFFSEDTLRHFREEEELLFPMLLERADSPPDVLVQILIEHVRIHGLVRRLSSEVESGSVESDTLLETGKLLQFHIRLEERTLFPLIEELVTEQDLGRLTLADRRGAPSQP
ncbi:MAG TPA: hemerythrin domain-containing protein [Actinomycetota bacterium]|nr:hemerythrin domain-containing protein [Actinomycetota bacterium]